MEEQLEDDGMEPEPEPASSPTEPYITPLPEPIPPHEPEPAEAGETLERQHSVAEQVLWMVQQEDGEWRALPAANSEALEAKWVERMDAENDVTGRSAGTAAAAAARVPIEVAKQMLGEVLADA